SAAGAPAESRLARRAIAGSCSGVARTAADPGRRLAVGCVEAARAEGAVAARAGSRRGEETAQTAAVAQPTGRGLECPAADPAVRLVLRMGAPDPALPDDLRRSGARRRGHAEGGAVPGTESATAQGPGHAGLA